MSQANYALYVAGDHNNEFCIPSYPHHETKLNGWKIVFTHPNETDEDELMDWETDKEIEYWLPDRKVFRAKLAQCNWDLLEYMCAEQDLAGEFTQYKVIEEVEYDGDQFHGHTQEMYDEDVEAQATETTEEWVRSVNRTEDDVQHLEDAMDGLLANQPHLSPSVGHKMRQKLADRSDAKVTSMYEEKLEEMQQMQEMLLKQMEEMKLANEQLRQAQPADAWQSVADEFGLNENEDVVLNRLLWDKLLKKGVLEVTARKKRFKGPSDLTEARLSGQKLVPQILAENEEAFALHSEFSHLRYHPSSGRQGKCSYLKDVCKIILSMPTEACDAENIRKVARIFEHTAKFVEKRIALQEFELFEKEHTALLQEEVQSQAMLSVDFCWQVAVKQRKLNAGRFGRRAELLKSGRRNKSSFVIVSASESDDEEHSL